MMKMFRIFFVSQLVCFTLVCSFNLRELCQSGIRDDGISYVHCARKSLTEVPSFSSNRLFNLAFDELILSDNFIDHISHNAFNGLRIKRLIMSGNHLKSLDGQAFRELENYLEELVIEFDSSVVDRIPQAIQNNLANVRSLTLIGLNLRRLPSNSFLHMKKLESLTLKSCRLQSIDRNAFNSIEKQLRHLSLDYNQLTADIFPELHRLVQLESLSLSHNAIDEFSMNYVNQHLRYFDLSYNQLKKITLINVNRLETLNLQNNLLTADQIDGTWPNQLKALILDFNSIHIIEKERFYRSNSLEFLSLQGNDLLLTHSDIFQYLNRLKRLNLARNNIQSVPHGLFRSTLSLEDLILDRNPLASLTAETFAGLEQTLKNFSCQSCSLTSESLLAFLHLSKLERLKLQSNYLKEIRPSTLFQSMTNLILIDLQRNQLNEIPNFWPSSIRELQIGNNQLKTFQLINGTTALLPMLTTLDLSQNPLHCDCQLVPLHRWLLQSYQAELVPYVQWICASPKNLTGKKLGSLIEKDFVCDDNDDEQEQKTKKLNSRINSFRARVEDPDLVILEWSLVEPISPELPIKLIAIENEVPLPILFLNTSENSFVLEKLKPSMNYTFCLQIAHQSSCDTVTTKTHQILSISSKNIAPPSHSSLSVDVQYLIILISLSIALVLIILFLLILFLLKQRNHYSKSSKTASIESYYQTTGSETTQIGLCTNTIDDRSSHVLRYPSNSVFCTCHLTSVDCSDPAQVAYHLYHEIPLYKPPTLI